MKKQFFIIPFVLISLLLGIYTGWLRMGWKFPPVPGLGEHGAIMVGSFLTTVIILERVITMKNKLILIVPFINAISVIFFLTDLYKLGYYSLLAGSIGLVGIMLYYTIKFKEYHNYLMLLGALCLMVGNLFLILILRYPASTIWWIAFFLLTITAERLELSRYLPINEKRKLLLVFLLVFFVVGVIIPFHTYGKYVSALALLFITLWLFMYDLALKSVKKDGVFRYTAILLLTGYVWLIITGAFFIVKSDSMLIYEAGLHAFFLGFVFSMIFAHAPIILPGILKINVKPYHPLLYLWFILLQLSLILRIAADVMGDTFLRQIGGKINGIVILGFFIDMIIYVMIQKKKANPEIVSKL